MRTPGGTLVHLGVVWGLRAVSPLWQQVWGVTDPHGVVRPARPCGGGPRSGCIENLHKAIILITDGSTWPGEILPSRLMEVTDPPNTHSFWENPGICEDVPAGSHQDYRDAAAASKESSFHHVFQAASLVDANGHFTQAALDTVADLLHQSDPNWSSPGDQAKFDAIRRLLDSRSWTPWQLFRELDPEVVDALMAPSPNGDPLEPANPFGFLGRPMHRGHYCELMSQFGPYGRIDDAIRVGETTPGQPAEPVPGVGPYETYGGHPRNTLLQRMEDWLIEACRVAGERKVKIIGIFLPRNHAQQAQFKQMQDCIAANGGDINRDVMYTPDLATLDEAFKRIFVHRRLLRYTDAPRAPLRFVN